jgi:2-polyprenyl-3-methyl-5-hydroxy-6-metoxy-1,4-benzoquinol methylase
MNPLIDRKSVENHFNAIAEKYEEWKREASYYYKYVMAGLQEIVPPGRRVLELGCGTGAILESLQPSYGVGIDLSFEMIAVARQKRPQYRFEVGDIEFLNLTEPFDYIVMVDIVEHLADLPSVFRRLSSILPHGTMLVSSSANPLWAPVLHLAEKLGMKMPEGDHRWPAAEELERLATAAGLETTTVDRRMILPKRIPGFSDWLNRVYPRKGLLARLNLIQILVFRKPKK